MTPMTKQQLKTIAPAIFAEKPHPRASEKYLFVPTHAIVDTLEQYGWYPVSVQQGKAKNTFEDRFQKHMIKFENPDMKGEKWGGNLQFIIINAHNVRMSLRGYIGYNVWVCQNGLVCGTVEDQFKVIHTVDKLTFVKQSLEGLFNHAQSKRRVIDDAHTIVLTKNEQGVFAQEAHALRWPKGSLVRPEELLKPKREEDRGDTLWKVFNVIQENLLKGDVEYEMHNATDHYAQRTRPILQLDKDVKINIALWNLMQKYVR